MKGINKTSFENSNNGDADIDYNEIDQEEIFYQIVFDQPNIFEEY